MSAEKVQYRKYMSRMTSCRYVFKNGKVAHFVMNQFATKIPSEIAELDAEIEHGHPDIYIDVNEKFVESDKIDPLAKLRKQIIAQYEAEKAAAEGRDFGTSASTQGVGMATTANIAKAAAANLSLGKK